MRVCVQSQLNKSTEAMKKCRCFFLILIGLLCIANRLYKEMLQQRDILLLLLPRATQTWQYILIKPSKEEEETCHAHVIWSMPCGKRNANEASKAKWKTALTVLCVCSCSLFLSLSLSSPSLLPSPLLSPCSPSLSPHFSFFFPCPKSPPRQHIKFSITNF